jgi:hypothetical protein
MVATQSRLTAYRPRGLGPVDRSSKVGATKSLVLRFATVRLSTIPWRWTTFCRVGDDQAGRYRLKNGASAIFGYTVASHLEEVSAPLAWLTQTSVRAGCAHCWHRGRPAPKYAFR